MTTAEYLALITSAFRDKTKFLATVSANVSPSVRVQDLLMETSELYDIDTAVGDQLDVLGKWVGISRQIPIPIPGVFFSWDGSDATLGWDQGIWAASSSQTEIT